MIDHVQTGTVLAVDDEPANLDLLVRILAAHDPVQIHTVSDPRSALSAFNEVRPDLVLLDVNMPHLSGLAVMDQLQKAIPHDRFLPIVVMTANTDPAVRREALAMGAHDFITKPFDASEVRLRVQNFLRTRQLYVQLEEQRQLLEERVDQRTADLQRTNEQLVTANHVKSDFLAMVSHEMRTPLTVIKGFTELIMKRWDRMPAEQRDRHAEAIDRNFARLESVIGNLLRAAELETTGDRQVFVTRPDAVPEIRLERLIRDAITDSRVDADTVRIDCARETTAKADPALWRPLLVNLLDNAHKYGQPPIDVGCTIQDDAIVLSVRDHGEGVPADFVDQMFERFTQASVGDRRTATGAGLGLWIARRLARGHGGDLAYEPATPGALFRAYVPLAPPLTDAEGA